jgi:hypothetical protein
MPRAVPSSPLDVRMKTIIHKNNYSNLQQLIQLLTSELLDESDIHTKKKNDQLLYVIWKIKFVMSKNFRLKNKFVIKSMVRVAPVQY